MLFVFKGIIENVFLTLALILRLHTGSTFHTFYSRGKAYDLLSHWQYKPLEFITGLLRGQRQVCVRDCLYPKVTRYSITGANLGKRAKPMRKEERLFVYCFNHIFHSSCKSINLQPGLYGVKKHQESTFT